MRRLLVTAIAILATAAAVLAAVTSGGGGSSRHPTVALAPSPDRSAQLVQALAVADYVHGLEVQQVADYLAAVQQGEVAAFLASLPAPLPAPSAAVELDLPPAPAAEAPRTGQRSYAWWEAIATCESGNTNAWRTGYYGLEGGPGVTYGGLSKSEQLAIAEGIYAQYGDGAWGCSGVAWSAVPSG